MAQHILSLEAPDTMNLCVLRLVDTSVYNPNSAPTCPILLVTPPGFVRATAIPNAQPGFIYNLTACDLGIQKENCGTKYYDLPDGIYILKYSVSPNDYVYVEYNHLRITKALNIIYEVLCELDLGACDPPEKIKNKLRELDLIKMYFLAAKAKVEICLQPKIGMEIYNYALRLLDKLRCCTSSCKR